MSATCSECGEAIPLLTSADEPALCAGCACPFCESMATACVPLEQEIRRLSQQLDEACAAARELLARMLFWAGEAGEDQWALMARFGRAYPWLLEAAEHRMLNSVPEANRSPPRTGSSDTPR